MQDFNTNRGPDSAGSADTDKRKELRFQNFVLLYVDILNQREPLGKLVEFPDDQSEYERFIFNLQQTFGNVHALLTAFQIVHESYSAAKSKTNYSLPEAQQKIIETFKNTGIHCQYFSDTILYFSALSNEEKKYIPISDVFSLFTIAAAVFLVALASKLVMRGTIEIGIGCEYPENHLYGPVLLHAHNLENNVAQYPRIVIGPKMMELLLLLEQVEGEETETKLNRRTAERCLRMIYQDIDGVLSLDYLGEEFRNMFIKEKNLSSEMQQVVNLAVEFVQNEYDKFRRNVNIKLAPRYLLLLNYLLSRKAQYWADIAHT